MPLHEFVLVKSEDNDFVTTTEFYLKLLGSTQSDIKKLSNKKCEIMGRVNLSDDLFSYFHEMFSWVMGKTDNDTNIPISLGANRWGNTTLDVQSQSVFSGIINGLMTIFSVAPEDIIILGNFIFNSEMDGGDYEKIYISKSEILNTLNALKDFIDKLNEDGRYLIHLGI